MSAEPALSPDAVTVGVRSHRFREVWSRRLMLSPAITVLVVGLVCPLIIVLVYSFLEAGTYGGVEWRFSLEAYQQFLFQRDIFDDSLSFSTAYLEIFGRSVLMAMMATTVCLAIGFPTAYFIATRPADQRMVAIGSGKSGHAKQRRQSSRQEKVPHSASPQTKSMNLLNGISRNLRPVAEKIASARAGDAGALDGSPKP